MKLILLLILTVLLCACHMETKPQIPETVTVVVTKYKPLPTWATDPLPLPQPKDDTVESHLKSENARGEIINLANCERLLLKKLDKGEKINKHDCDTK